MQVVEVLTSQHELRYVVLDEQGEFVLPVVRYLKHLDRIGYARNTQRAYAFMLKLFFEYLGQAGLDYHTISIESLAQFVYWLKLPSGALQVLPVRPVEQARSNRTINYALTVISGFYTYLWRIGEVATDLTEQTTVYLPPYARQYKGFLHHLAASQPVATHVLKQKEPKRKRPKTIPKPQVWRLMQACSNQRDRLLIWLLYESSLRIGEALALWVEDVDVSRCHLHVRDRGPLANGAEIKTPSSERSVDVSEELINEILAYVNVAHTSQVATNHLFIKLYGVQRGQPLTYADIASLFQRLKRKTGIDVTPHVLRHSSLSALAKAGWKPELLQARAGHATFQHTYQLYVHVSEEDLQEAWAQTQQVVTIGAAGISPLKLGPREE